MGQTLCGAVWDSMRHRGPRQGLYGTVLDCKSSGNDPKAAEKTKQIVAWCKKNDRWPPHTFRHMKGPHDR